jgi:hypothetical protein
MLRVAAGLLAAVVAGSLISGAAGIWTVAHSQLLSLGIIGSLALGLLLFVFLTRSWSPIQAEASTIPPVPVSSSRVIYRWTHGSTTWIEFEFSAHSDGVSLGPLKVSPMDGIGVHTARVDAATTTWAAE